MKLKVGDKVKFLNESGGGVVSKILSATMVNVAIEDSFDVPVMTNELVKIQSDEEDLSKQFFSEDYNVDLEARKNEENSPLQETYQRESPIQYALTQSQGTKGVYLAYVPQQQNWLVTGLIDLYLYNNTEYELMFNISLRSQDVKFYSADSGSMKAKTRILIGSFDRDDLETWVSGIVQTIYIPKVTAEVPLPGHYVFKVKPSRFYKEDAYKANFLMREKAILQLLTDVNNVEIHSEDVFSLKFEANKPKEQKAKIVKKKELIDKHKIGDKKAEVDLHISALRDDFNTMKANEILNYQLQYCRQAIDNALVNQYKSVVFIHGIGNGTLKNEIRKILKEYDVSVRNASFQQYGTGAIEVQIFNQ